MFFIHCFFTPHTLRSFLVWFSSRILKKWWESNWLTKIYVLVHYCILVLSCPELFSVDRAAWRQKYQTRIENHHETYELTAKSCDHVLPWWETLNLTEGSVSHVECCWHIVPIHLSTLSAVCIRCKPSKRKKETNCFIDIIINLCFWYIISFVNFSSDLLLLFWWVFYIK